MNEKPFKGPEGLRQFLKEEVEKKRKDLYEKSLNLLYKGDIEKALIAINNSMLFLLKEKLGAEEENELLEDLITLKNAKISGITDRVCYEGMSYLTSSYDLGRAKRLSIGLQNLIKDRPPEKREREFLQTVEEFAKRDSIS